MKRKALGQHFLVNPRVIKKIVEFISPDKNDLIFEIGAGKGALTFPLAEKARKIIAIEKDKNLIPFINEKKSSNIEVLEQDALKIEYKELIQKETFPYKKTKLVGNLPYSISSPLLFKLLEDKELFHSCVFLLQKEVAERINAGPGTKKYAPISIFFQLYFEIKILFTVKPGSFSPPPKVESALTSFRKREKPQFQIRQKVEFRNFVKGAFRHRRKTLHNNLTRLEYPASLLKETFQNLEIKNSLRPEQLSIGQFVNLFTCLSKVKSKT